MRAIERRLSDRTDRLRKYFAFIFPRRSSMRALIALFAAAFLIAGCSRQAGQQDSDAVPPTTTPDTTNQPMPTPPPEDTTTMPPPSDVPPDETMPPPSETPPPNQ
jgi:hypothetical protein